jgi:hypothetical protein
MKCSLITLPEDFSLKAVWQEVGLEDGSEMQCGFRIMFRHFKLLA